MNDPATTKPPEQLQLSPACQRGAMVALFVGGGALLLAIIWAHFVNTPQRFYYAYLTNYAFFLSIALGALFFVLLQHLTRAGWSVGPRRIAEILACALPVLAALSAPILLSVIMQKGELYSWASHGTHDGHGLASKAAYLNAPFFIARLLIYFAVWSGLGVWYWRCSIRQDVTQDDSLTSRMQAFAPPATLAFALTLTFGAFDLLMSLDSAWFSTIFGVYYFAGCAVAIFATMIVLLNLLEKSGYLMRSVTREHFHDLGKFLFAFTFFWGYIAFSQYMLIWYANIPETTGWFARRGASTVSEHVSGWSTVSLMLLFGHLLIPFGGLMSRHVKRRRQALLFWAVWMLLFHWLDLYWLVMPQLDGKVHFGPMELLCFVGIGGIYCSAVLRIALGHSLRPMGDPRLGESLAFENI